MSVLLTVNIVSHPLTSRQTS